MTRREPPKPLPLPPETLDVKDAAGIVGRTLVSLVPGVGGPAAELFNLVIAPSLERRRQGWLVELGERVACLEAEGRLTLDDLKGNEAFVDVVLQASRAALATSSAEKRAALRNAALNSALPGAPEEAECFMFLRYVEDFTEWHLRILKLLQAPTEWQKRRAEEAGEQPAGSLAQVLEAAYPELVGQEAVCAGVMLDLTNAQFVNDTPLHAKMSGRGMLKPRITERGSRLLRFIEEP